MTKLTCLLIALLTVMAAAMTATTPVGQSNGVLAGLVVTSSGEAARSMRVVLVEERTGLRRETTTDELGIYAFSLLPPGDYRLETARGSFFPRGMERVSLKPGEKRSWRLVWDPGDGRRGPARQAD